MLGDKRLEPYPQTSEGGLAVRATIKQRLIREQAELQQRLERINDALEAMNKYPEMTELLERVAKVI